MNSEQTITVVLHTRYGGFHLTQEMRDWLVENCKWDAELFSYGHGGFWFRPRMDEIETRSHPDLIACVRALQEKHKDASYFEQNRMYIFGLEIVTRTVRVSIEDYNDGKERLVVSTE